MHLKLQVRPQLYTALHYNAIPIGLGPCFHTGKQYGGPTQPKDLIGHYFAVLIYLGKAPHLVNYHRHTSYISPDEGTESSYRDNIALYPDAREYIEPSKATHQELGRCTKKFLHEY